MHFTYVACQIIPGYHLLSAKQKKTFKDSEAGRKFVQVVNDILKSAKLFDEKNIFWKWVAGGKEKLQDSFQEKINNLLVEIKETIEYQLVKDLIKQEKARNDLLDVICRIIPGFNLLSTEEKYVFEYTEEGQAFIELINEGLEEPDESCDELPLPLRIIQGSEIYKTVKIQIIHAWFKKNYSELSIDLSVWNDEQQQTLAAANFSKSIQESIIPLETKIEETQKKLDELLLALGSDDSEVVKVTDILKKLKIERERQIKEWCKNFWANEDMLPLRSVYVASKIEALTERAERLAQVLPILGTGLFEGKLSPVNRLINKYNLAFANAKDNPDLDKLEEEFLTEILFQYIQKTTQTAFGFIALHNFNLKQANELAQKILHAFNQQEDFQMDTWLGTYQQNLAEHIQKQLFLVNGKKREIKEEGEEQESAFSLSHIFQLFTESKQVQSAKEGLDKVANAHAFFQSSGLASQNESSFLVLIDLYNYYRFEGEINENKGILFSLINPFLPIYEEYRNIALYEKNFYWKIFRIVMPLLIIAAVVVATGALLAPLGVTELAFLLAAIPAIIVGLALATKYITLKNSFYDYVNEKIHGGPYEVPEYQVSHAMEGIFGSVSNAEKIRQIYIEEISFCDKLEAKYKAKQKDGFMTLEDKKLREENNLKRVKLSAEWYDIHSNDKLVAEDVRQIVAKRLQQIAEIELGKFEEIFETNDKAEIGRYIQRIINDFKVDFIPDNAPAVVDNLVQNDARVIAEMESPIVKNSEIKTPPVRSFTSSNYSPTLFKPHSLLHRDRAVSLTLVAEALSPKVVLNRQERDSEAQTPAISAA